MKKVAIVGTQGVPARYGGFETLVENLIGENCSQEVQYTVFCSSKDLDKTKNPVSYKHALLRYVPLHANGIQSIPYDMWSLLKSMRKYDVILVLGTSGCCLLPVWRLFCRKRLVVNIDGLEHRRAKWGKMARRFLKMSESMAIRFADTIIVDNQGIQDYVSDNYHRETELIAYGGDHVVRQVSEQRSDEILKKYGLQSGEYSIAICRIEPENNCHVILLAFEYSDQKLVMIGNWQHSEYSCALKKRYNKSRSNILLVDSLYDLEELSVLRTHAGHYIHGYSAGGTNPSLVEAMFFNCPILCFDVVYNRKTTFECAYYWKDAAELNQLLLRRDLTAEKTKAVAESNYLWRHIARQYEALY